MIRPDKQPITEAREDYHEGLWGRVHHQLSDEDRDPTWTRDVILMVVLAVAVTLLGSVAARAIEASWTAQIAGSIAD